MPVKSAFKIVACAAILASLTLHVVAMAIAPQFDEDVQIIGGEETVAAALGNNFEDLVKAGDELSPIDAETLEPVEPEALDAPLEPEVISAPTPPTMAAATVPITPAPLTDMAMLAPTEPAQTIEAQPDEPIIPVPNTRPFRQIDKDRLEKASLEKDKPKPKVKRKKTTKKAQPVKKKKTASGNVKSKAKSNAKAGTATGNKGKKNTQAGKKKSKNSSKAGNAAASNYPGKVRSKISRTRQKNAGGKGVARVRFNVNSSGGATGIAIANSSGNSKVDRAAIAHIKRASPFPKPPAGAQRQFVIPLEFRR
ncbi:TonB family protein [Ahrensia kielensis]|uniref:TonB family protein n=1 Tax=Ahrensia kielensis TaxID=76980 RepID=A0ABU9T244_9HYPH